MISSRLTKNGTGQFLVYVHVYFLSLSFYWRVFFSPIFLVLFRDNFILLQAIVAWLLIYMFPTIGKHPLWNKNGIITTILLHIAISEPIFYSIHKSFHGEYLFSNYHSLHHSSTVPQAYTGKSFAINVNSFFLPTFVDVLSFQELMLWHYFRLVIFLMLVQLDMLHSWNILCWL